MIKIPYRHETKTCSRCGQVKLSSEFHDLWSGGINYLQAYCKSCVKDRWQEKKAEKKQFPKDDRILDFRCWDILNKTALFYGIPASVIISKSRLEDITKARHVAMSLMKDLTGLSLENIAVFFNRRDHTTVRNAIEQTQLNYATDFQIIKNKIEWITQPQEQK